MIGAVVMVHGDDNGLVLPPRVAPIQAVIVPIWRGDDPKEEILAAAATQRDQLVAAGIAVKIDDRDNVNPGFKYNEWEMLGVPVRLELGPKDIEKRSVMTVRRLDRKKEPVALGEAATRVPQILDEMQADMLAAATQRRDEATYRVDSYDAFKRQLEETGGFLLAHWCGSDACEGRVQEETKATIRCIPLDKIVEDGNCMICDAPSSERVHFAKAY